MIPPIQSAEATQTGEVTCRKRVRRSSSGLTTGGVENPNSASPSPCPAAAHEK